MGLIKCVTYFVGLSSYAAGEGQQMKEKQHVVWNSSGKTK